MVYSAFPSLLQITMSRLHVYKKVCCNKLRFDPSGRNAYNMVINKFGDYLYNGLVETLKKHLEGVAEKIASAQGELFLRELKLRWDHHNKSMQMIRDILMVCLSNFLLNLEKRYLCLHQMYSDANLCYKIFLQRIWLFIRTPKQASKQSS